MSSKHKQHTYPPPSPDNIPHYPVIKHQGQWGFWMRSGMFWAYIDQASGPELRRRYETWLRDTGRRRPNN